MHKQESNSKFDTFFIDLRWGKQRVRSFCDLKDKKRVKCVDDILFLESNIGLVRIPNLYFLTYKLNIKFGLLSADCFENGAEWSIFFIIWSNFYRFKPLIWLVVARIRILSLNRWKIINWAVLSHCTS
jgi:hypothetical protein